MNVTNFWRFNALLLAAFPELSEPLAKEEGLHLKTLRFLEFANAAIAREDWPKLQQCYVLIERVLAEHPDEDVRNAVCISFIEHLDFNTDERKGAYAKNLLPAALLAEWNRVNDIWQKLGESVKARKRRNTRIYKGK